MCPGEFEDRMGDAFARLGRVPITRRTRVAPPEDPALRTWSRAPFCGYFAQFIAAVRSTHLRRRGHAVIEARWFGEFPPEEAFRDDYLADFQKVQPGTTF